MLNSLQSNRGEKEWETVSIIPILYRGAEAERFAQGLASHPWHSCELCSCISSTYPVSQLQGCPEAACAL